MTVGEFGPLAAAVVLATIAGILSPRLAPRLAARLLLIASAATLSAIVWSLALVALAGLGGRTGLLWPDLVPEHHQLPELAGVAALALLTVGTCRGLARAMRLHRTRRAWRVDGPLDLQDLDRPTAFAVPGRHGGVVIDQGLWTTLSAGERRVVLAHERAHLDHNHHRHITLAESLAAACPALVLASRRIRFSLERWADEDAAVVVADRLLVARTVARVALIGGPDEEGLGFGGSTVVNRVEALLGPVGDDRRWAAIGRFDAAAVVALALLQLHHVVMFVTHVD